MFLPSAFLSLNRNSSTFLSVRVVSPSTNNGRQTFPMGFLQERKRLFGSDCEKNKTLRVNNYEGLCVKLSPNSLSHSTEKHASSYNHSKR